MVQASFELCSSTFRFNLDIVRTSPSSVEGRNIAESTYVSHTTEGKSLKCSHLGFFVFVCILETNETCYCLIAYFLPV